MKKFLQISGVLFWVQIILIAGYITKVTLDYPAFKDGIDAFKKNFISQILEQKDYSQTSLYFSDELMVDNERIENILDALGMLNGCAEDVTWEFTEKSAEVVFECTFENDTATFVTHISRLNGAWVFDYFRMHSDVYKLVL